MQSGNGAWYGFCDFSIRWTSAVMGGRGHATSAQSTVSCSSVMIYRVHVDNDRRQPARGEFPPLLAHSISVTFLLHVQPR